MQRITASGTEPINPRLLNTPTSAKKLRCANCNGMGGILGSYAGTDVYGLRYYKSWCLCPAGVKAREDYEAKRREAENTNAPTCELCHMTGVLTENNLLYRDRDDPPWCECPKGQEEKAQFDAKRKVEKGRRRAEQIEEWLECSRIPVRYANASAEDFQGAELTTWQEAQDAINFEDGTGVLIWGDVGSGKTHFACGLLRSIIEDYREGVFVTVPDLLDAIRRNYDVKPAEREDLLTETMETTAVLLDDLAAEKPTDWVREKLYQLINGRYNACRVTIATTNLPPDQLAAQIGDRTVSRLVEMCKIIHLTGEDRRVKPQQLAEAKRVKEGANHGGSTN